MRFKVDESLPVEVAMMLRDAAHDAVTVAEQDLRGESDVLLAEAVRRENRALITLDLDFADIRAYPPEDYAGIIVMRVGRQGKAQVLGVFERILPLLDREPLTRHLWIVDEQTIRVRGIDEGQQAH